MYADQIMNAMEDAERLFPHGAHNAEIVGGEDWVRKAIGNPVREDVPNAVPLLRSVSPGIEAVALIDGMLNVAPHRTSTQYCERCVGYFDPERPDRNKHFTQQALDNHPGKHRLAVTAGASVILIHCCEKCRANLPDDLIWDY